MKNNFEDLDLESLAEEIEAEAPLEEGEFERSQRIFDKSHSIIKEAMASVIQEMVIKLDGEEHIVYIHELDIKPNGEVAVKFSTPSDKDILYPHVMQCLKSQFEMVPKKRGLFF